MGHNQAAGSAAGCQSEVEWNMNVWHGRRRRAGRVAALMTLLGLPLLVGCGRAIVGDWRMVQAIPNRDVFCVDEATFRRDGTFTATTTIEGRTSHETGTYQFTGFKLRLRPQAGGQRAYTAQLKPGELLLRDGERKVVLKKVKKGK